jgi:drug/metabolite transporter (DMT)-like permease
MPILAIILLLTSAAFHALWNLLLKQAKEKYIAMSWQVIISSLLSLGLLLFTGLPPRTLWLLVIASTILEAIYFGILTYAYTDNDFSLIYPMARGAAPALVVVWTALFLGEIPSTGCFVGIILVVAGLATIGSTSLLNNHAEINPTSKPKFKGVALALSIALIISIYTLVDGYAVKNGPALTYGLSLFLTMPVLTTPLIVRHYGWKQMVGTIKLQPGRLILVGILGLVAYMLALFAYSMAPVNYSEAIREVSVVMGAIAGWYFLGEQMGKIRIAGAVVIFAGIALIAALG